jgi:glycine/D-amino acid oxidase-like deaminating enzyme
MSNIVIVGAGIIGISTAYFLSHSETFKEDSTITIIDQCPPASGASGKAGAFIARNWSGGATSSLAELSFRLHDELAQKYNGAERWGYWRCKALSVVGKNSRGDHTLGDLTRSVRLQNVTPTSKSEELGWVKPGVVQSQNLLGDEDSIAVWYAIPPSAAN